MDLSFLIPSKVRRNVLEYFVKNPEAQVHVRELARELTLSPQLVYRELLNMENWGFLFSSKRGNQRVFRLNKKFPFYPVMCDLINIYKKEQNRTYKIKNVYKLNDVVKRLSKIPAPTELIPGLLSKDTKPRAFDEQKILEKHEKKLSRQKIRTSSTKNASNNLPKKKDMKRL